MFATEAPLYFVEAPGVRSRAGTCYRVPVWIVSCLPPLRSLTPAFLPRALLKSIVLQLFLWWGPPSTLGQLSDR